MKAHNGPVMQLLKTNDGLVLTSSDASDPVVKLWDLKGLLNPALWDSPGARRTR